MNDIIKFKKNENFSDDIYDITYLDQTAIKARIVFLEKFAEVMDGKIGAVAEAGVFTGEFSKEINKNFPDSTLYLFDTFTGFDFRDIEFEEVKSDMVQKGGFSHSNDNPIEVVLSKCLYKDKVEIYKGYFPETVPAKIYNEKFIFVNLDMDLYKPTLEGLRLFYPLLIDGGVILIHDYFGGAYPNIKTAIFDFEKELGYQLHKLPIGDGLSMAIVK